MSKDIQSYVINLENRKERYVSIKKNLYEFGFENPIRFRAVEDKYGEVGCAKSHFCLLSNIYSKREDNKYILILEDDYRFSISEGKLLSICAELEKQKTNFDVFQLHVSNPLFTDYCEIELEGKIVFIKKILAGSSTAAYLTKRSFLPELIRIFLRSSEIFESSYAHLSNNSVRKRYNHKFATDTIWRELQAKHLFVGLEGKIGTIDRSFISDIQKEQKNLKVLGE